MDRKKSESRFEIPLCHKCTRTDGLYDSDAMVQILVLNSGEIGWDAVIDGLPSRKRQIVNETELVRIFFGNQTEW
jgi:hypothetical protein